MTLGVSLTLSGLLWNHLHEEVRILSPSKGWGCPVSPRPIPLKDLAAEGKSPCPSLPRPTCPQHWKGQGPTESRLGGQEVGKARQWKSWEPPQFWASLSVNQGLNCPPAQGM